jgi:hypothetical protein
MQSTDSPPPAPGPHPASSLPCLLLAGCTALLLLLAVPTAAHAGAVRFKTPGLAPPALDLPPHDSLLLSVEGWSSDSFESVILQGWRDLDQGDTGGDTFGLEWTGPGQRNLVANPKNAGKTPLRVEVTVNEPAARDKWDSGKRESAQYGPVVIKESIYLVTRTVDVRVDVAVRGSDGEIAQATSASAQATQSGNWETSEESAEAHAPSADVVASPLIDGLAAEIVIFLDKLVVRGKPRSFALEKNKACKKEIAGCLEALDVLKRSDDLVGAYEAMKAIEGGDAWIAYNAAVLAAALHRYDEAREHVAAAKELEDHGRFDKLIRYIRDWETEDQALRDGGYPAEDPK